MSRRWPSWVRTALAIALVIAGLATAYAFNIFIGLPLVIIGVAIAISHVIQREKPPEPGG